MHTADEALIVLAWPEEITHRSTFQKVHVLVVVAILAGLAAALHFFIFYLEVFGWAGALARKIFGPQSEEKLAITSFYAYNQGVYNFALAVIAALGVIFLFTFFAVGAALVAAGCGSMLLAALAIGAASPQHRGAAVKQGTLPLLALVALLVAVAL